MTIKRTVLYVFLLVTLSIQISGCTRYTLTETYPNTVDTPIRIGEHIQLKSFSGNTYKITVTQVGNHFLKGIIESPKFIHGKLARGRYVTIDYLSIKEMHRPTYGSPYTMEVIVNGGVHIEGTRRHYYKH